MNNLRFAFRSLLKSPLVTGVAMFSLALGIGANAAIFSIFERLLLRPLPVSAPQELVNLENPGPKPGSQSTGLAGGMDSVFSYPMFRDLERAESVPVNLAAFRHLGVNLSHGGSTLSGSGLLVSGGYFEVLGLQPAAGRLISRADDEAPGAHSVVVLSHAFWRSRFENNPSVVGDTLVVNGQPLTILGVAPEGFAGTTLGRKPEVFVPITLRAALVPGWDAFEERRNYWAYLFGRLGQGVSLEQAETAMGGVYSALINEVELPLQTSESERLLKEFAAKTIVLKPGHQGQSSLHGMLATPLGLLLGVTAFVLLIACANIANLLLVKATNRSGEIAVRLSIGAQRHQLVGQFLTESFLLAAAGGVLGLFVAHGTVRLLTALAPPQANLGLASAIGPSTWVFLVVLSAVTGLVGLFPALHSTRSDLVAALKYQAGKTSPSRIANRFRTAMATLQIALSMALLISAGLFTKSLVNVSRVDLGLETEHIVTFGLSPRLNGYSSEDATHFYQRVEETLGALPGVENVMAALVPLIADDSWGNDVSVEGFANGPDVDSNSRFNRVGSGYFATLGVPLLAGRDFDSRDVSGAPKVAIVNEKFAEKFGLGRRVVGKRMDIDGGGEFDVEIVGLMKDTKYNHVKAEVPPLYFEPYLQAERQLDMNFYVRSTLDPAALMPALRKSLAGLDAHLPVEGLRTLDNQVHETIFLDRMLSTLSATFAILATLLAALGLYGVMAYSVAQRTREIGLRMALGADAWRVRGLILRQVGGLTLVGAALGLAGALALGRVAKSLLYGLEGNDPAVFGGAAAVLIAVSLGAGLLPAQRAAGTDPLVALREE